MTILEDLRKLEPENSGRRRFEQGSDGLRLVFRPADTGQGGGIMLELRTSPTPKKRLWARLSGTAEEGLG